MRRQDKYPNTKIFNYLNVNPHNRITTDCVVRAIAKAVAPKRSSLKTLKRYWHLTLNELCTFSDYTGYALFDTNCYSRYLQSIGFVEHKQPRHPDNTKYTLREFIEEHPKGVYLVNLPGHLTVVEDGVNYDIWDCTKRESRIGKFWELKKRSFTVA